MPKKIEKAIWNVKIICPVIVKPYGNKPIRLAVSINVKINKTKGKYFKATMLLICCLNNCNTNR